MQPEPQIAFPIDETDIRVNFGIFAGREATPAEIDDLAQRLLPEIGEVSIVSEQRHEIDEQVEAAVHQVRIELDRALGEDLRERLVEIADGWARSCIAERSTELSEL